jgi:prepilin-type N-terminal cleavage/methylation domain-containing protein
MKLFKKLLLHKNEAGFSLIEIMVSIVITGFIGLGATISSLQVLTETSRNEDYTTASRNTMNAVFWISRDAQMAQTISGVAGFPETSSLSLTWEDWNNSSHNATYSVQNGRLFRSYDVDGNINQSLIAEFINTSPDSTNCTSVNGTLILTITSSVGEGSRVVNVTRVREMTARPRQ